MKKQFIVAMVALLGLAGVVSCSKKSEYAYNQPLAWTAYGATFTANGGKALNFKDYVEVSVSAEKMDCSSVLDEHGQYLVINIPKSTSVAEGMGVIFHTPSGNTPSSKMDFKYNYNDKEVTVSLRAVTASGEVAEGKITVPFCNNEKL